MKDQYFGDVNDYRKYGLLRALLANNTLDHALCWMLTPSDGRSDGKFVNYLGAPARWRHFDPSLFEFLWSTVLEGRRRAVRELERSSLLPRTVYHSPIIPDDLHGRKRYFEEFSQTSRVSDLVFFDPDNGLEVTSVPRGRRGSSKYLYWSELHDTYQSGPSVLTYQHFRREKRDHFITRMAHECSNLTRAPWIGAFTTSNVLFLLLPQDRHASALQDAARHVHTTWLGQVSFELFRGR